MPSIAEVNAENAPKSRTDADALAGLTVAADAAKAARETARTARAEAARLAKVASDAAKAAREARESAPKLPTVRDSVRIADAAILAAAGKIVTEMELPEGINRAEVAALVSNQLHHLAAPKVGWPETGLPVPDRSEWK